MQNEYDENEREEGPRSLTREETKRLAVMGRQYHRPGFLDGGSYICKATFEHSDLSQVITSPRGEKSTIMMGTRMR